MYPAKPRSHKADDRHNIVKMSLINENVRDNKDEDEVLLHCPDTSAHNENLN